MQEGRAPSSSSRCSVTMRTKVLTLSFLFALLGLLLLRFSEAAYNTNATVVPGKLNVHLVAHSHDDVGWLRTVDEYYTSEVRSIITSVVNHLKENPDRKYIQVEQAFFQRWWKEQHVGVQELVKNLVKSGQLDFVNGGWCMHDEATTHYVDMIDQTTLGHSFLKETFGKAPRIGWQIDPFGHSAVQAYLLGTEIGFDGLFFARLDYQDREHRIANKSLEFIWEGSRTQKSDNQIFTGAFLRHYNPPQTFDYENSDKILIQDDPSKGTVNVKDRVEDFISAANVYAAATKTNHVMWTMGDDFTYMDASVWYDQMDKLIHYVNKDGRVNALYSTPSIYVDAKQAANETWSVKKNDFFPYGDGPTSYWSGYFSSRVALKGYVRSLSGFFQAARQLEVLIGKKATGPNSDSLWRALSVVQHHDGVSGTEQQHVANDYTKQLAAGAAETQTLMNSAISCLAKGTFPSACQGNETAAFVQCPLSNISYCPASEAKLSPDTPLVVTVYNPLGWARKEYIQITVSSNTLIVIDGLGKPVRAQLAPVSNATRDHRSFYVKAELGLDVDNGPLYWLVFKAEVPPLGFSSYTVRPSHPGEPGVAVNSDVYDMKKNKTLSEIDVVQQSYNWYAGYVGSQSSGAYIFRPADKNSKEIISNATFIGVDGPLYQAVRRQVTPWIYKEHRFYTDEDHVEFEYMVGPIPVEDGIGKEFTVNFKTDMGTNGKFYTDSNGRDFIERTRDKPDWDYKVVQPVAANYYPVNLGAYVRDNKTDFSVLVDRATGVSSLADGELELMLHRRLLQDDGRGVSEPLNERVCAGSRCEGLTVTGKLHYIINPVDKAARWRRQHGQTIYSPLQLFFGNQNASASLPRFSFVKNGYVLPDNVVLLTIQELQDKTVLLRLAHIFEADEDTELSKPATVDLKQLLWTWEIQSISELSLSANQAKSSMKRMNWKVSDTLTPGSKRGAAIDPKQLLLELGPMEIRTLQLTVKSKSVNS